MLVVYCDYRPNPLVMTSSDVISPTIFVNAAGQPLPDRFVQRQAGDTTASFRSDQRALHVYRTLLAMTVVSQTLRTRCTVLWMYSGGSGSPTVLRFNPAYAHH